MQRRNTTTDIFIAVCEDLDTDKNRLVDLIEAYLTNNHINAGIDVYSSGEEFLASDINVYSLVFFDIYMDELNGMETAKKLVKENYSVQLIFVSSTRDFAAESYDVSALHYLIKPVEEEKLYMVLDKFFEAIHHMKIIQLKVGRSIETVYMKDILYVESQNKKTLVHMKKYVIEASMPFALLCELLPEPDYVKTIRYALVSVKEITKVPADTLELSDGTTIPVSRALRSHVKDVFTEYQWKSAFARNGVRL